MAEDRPQLQVVRTEPVALQAYRALRQGILQGQFKAGSRLIETEVAEMLGISRTPVREALSKLEAEGLVDLLPTGGMVVRDIEAELEEIYGLRQRVEGYAAYLAALRITPEALAGLEEVCKRARAAVDTRPLEERAELNNTFHRLLTEASGSARLIRLTSGYREYFLNQQILRFYDRDTSLRRHEQHRQIVEALRQRDPERAERLVVEHFQSALAVIRAGRQSRQGGPPDPSYEGPP